MAGEGWNNDYFRDDSSFCFCHQILLGFSAACGKCFAYSKMHAHFAHLGVCDAGQGTMYEVRQSRPLFFRILSCSINVCELAKKDNNNCYSWLWYASLTIAVFFSYFFYPDCGWYFLTSCNISTPPGDPFPLQVLNGGCAAGYIDVFFWQCAWKLYCNSILFQKAVLFLTII